MGFYLKFVRLENLIHFWFIFKFPENIKIIIQCTQVLKIIFHTVGLHKDYPRFLTSRECQRYIFWTESVFSRPNTKENSVIFYSFPAGC